MEDGTIDNLKWKIPPPDTFLLNLQFNSYLFLPFYHTTPTLAEIYYNLLLLLYNSCR
jgi:hypothetical protein